MAEFGIYRVVTCDGRIVVDGRCHEGPLRRGGIFRKVYRPDEQGNAIESLAVDLIVERIVAYEHEMEELDAGLTARITLRGVGRLQVPWVLAEE